MPEGMSEIPLVETQYLGKGEAGTVSVGKFEKGQTEYAFKTITQVDAKTFLDEGKPEDQQRPELRLYHDLADTDWRTSHVVVPNAINRVVDDSGVERAQLIMPLFTEGSVKDIMDAKDEAAKAGSTEQVYMDYSQFETMARNLFTALETIHSHGVTHTDIHADQLMLNGSEFFLLDFSRASDMTQIYTEIDRVSALLSFLLVGPKGMMDVSQKYPESWQVSSRQAAAEDMIKNIYGQETVDLMHGLSTKAYRAAYKGENYDPHYDQLIEGLLATVKPKYLERQSKQPVVI